MQTPVLSIDKQTKQVVYQERPLHLTPNSFALLCYLMDKAPAVVSPEEMLEHIWQGKVVSKDSVKQQIKTLRKQMEGAGDLIESVRGHGYRFVAFDEATGQSVNEPVDGRIENSLTRTWLAVISVVSFALLLVAFSLYRSTSESTISLPLKVVIMPFEVFSDENSTLSNMLQDELVTRLAANRNVRVLALSSINHAELQDLTAQEYLKQFGVQLLFEGSIRREKDITNVNIRMVWTETGFTAWQENVSVTNHQQTELFHAVEAAIQPLIERKIEYVQQESTSP